MKLSRPSASTPTSADDAGSQRPQSAAPLRPATESQITKIKTVRAVHSLVVEPRKVVRAAGRLRSHIVPRLGDDGVVRLKREPQHLVQPPKEARRNFLPQYGLLSVLEIAFAAAGIEYVHQEAGYPNDFYPPGLEPTGGVLEPGVGELIAGGLGLLRYDPRHVDLARVVSRIFAAYPGVGVYLITGSAAAANHWQRRLQSVGLPVLRSGSPHENPGAIFVGPPWQASYLPRLEQRTLVIYAQATDALELFRSHPVRFGWGQALLGCLPCEVRLSPHEWHGLTELFGPRQALLERPGGRRRAVQLRYVSCQDAGGRRFRPDEFQFRRQAYWTNPIRNRRLAAAGRALADCQPAQFSARYFDEGEPALDRPPRVILLAAHLEHAGRLCDAMPNWPLLAAGSARNAPSGLLKRVTSMPPDGSMIATLQGATALPADFADVILWAGGGPSLPALPVELLLTRRAASSPLVVIDCDDRFNPQARLWSRQRRRQLDLLRYAHLTPYAYELCHAAVRNLRGRRHV